MEKITSVFLPAMKLVYRVGGTIVNASKAIASIEQREAINPLVFDLYDDQNMKIATIYANEAVVTYEYE